MGRLLANTLSQLSTANSIIPLNTEVIETDTGNRKVGDGTSHYNSLPYVGDVNPAGGVPSGSYFFPVGQDGAQTPNAPTLNREIAVPFFVPIASLTLAEIDLEISTAVASSFARIGLRNHDYLTGTPAQGTVLFDSGQLDTSTTGTKTAACSVTLKRGWYWYSVTGQGTGPATFRSHSTNINYPGWLTSSTTPGATASSKALNQILSANVALPSTWTTNNVTANPARLIFKAA